VSADGTWESLHDGIKNDVLFATGQRAGHEFYASLPPLYVLNDGRPALTIIMVIKPVYSMESRDGHPTQLLSRIDLATIPNGLLLTRNPGYLAVHKGLLFPGKDDKGKDPRKMRSRISFSLLREIDHWRHQTVYSAGT
jgi:hypothetical protein